MAEIIDSQLGGNGVAVHFHEDGAFVRAALPTGTGAVYGDVCDLGERLGGLTVRVVAESAITGLSGTAGVAFAILGCDDKDAPATGTAWETLATINADKDYAAGDTIGAFTPAPGEGKKYYTVSVTNGAAAEGKFSVWNELTR